MSRLQCPVCRSVISATDRCASCNHDFPLVRVGVRHIPDLRRLDTPTCVQVSFAIPPCTVPTEEIQRVFEPPVTTRQTRYATRLTPHLMRHIEQYPDRYAPVLDLGCGSGDNRIYLCDLGFSDVTCVDYHASGADYLADAHRLPFADASFGMVLSTAVMEHLYNPFVAIGEIARVLHPGGVFLATGSFWERWHGRSHFHLTPDGWLALCHHANLEIIAIWSGWGGVESVLAHGFYMPRALAHWGQRIVDRLLGQRGRNHRLHTSGSYGIAARK